MKNLHLKNLKDNNIEQIKQSRWFKQFNKRQQAYIEIELKHNLNVNKFAKPELKATEMLDILRSLEEEKYGKILTKYPIPIFYIEPPRKLQTQKIINELNDEEIQSIFDKIDDEEIQRIINELGINESN
jgi:hypothetical protein